MKYAAAVIAVLAVQLSRLPGAWGWVIPIALWAVFFAVWDSGHKAHP